jgi:hypothetical protein
MTVSVTLPAPLGQRTVMINADTTDVFAPSGSARLRRCGPEGCGPFPAAPPGRCDAASFQEAMLSTGPPASATYWAVGCDSGWLVLDVGWPSAAACDGPACTHELITRWFYRDTPGSWKTIASARTGGCAQVHKVEPQFPSSLCASLPAP